MQYVFLTIFLTVYGQLIIKWQVNIVGSMPDSMYPQMMFLTKLIFNPWIISGFIAAFVAALSWMLAMTKLQLSYAYPFVSLTFVFVLIFSALLLNEPLSWQKVIGLMFVVLGVCVSSFS